MTKLTLCVRVSFCAAETGIKRLLINEARQDAAELVKEQAFNCPSGRLVITDKDKNKILPDFKPMVSVTSDPRRNCYGPIWVKGDVEIRDEFGNPYEMRKSATLCRCGESDNKPFCDSKHYKLAHMQGVEEDI